MAFAKAGRASGGFRRRRRGFAGAAARGAGLGGGRFGELGHGGSMESLGQSIKRLEFLFRSD